MVRVIRGHNLKSIYAPGSGFRYDGLYKVTAVLLALRLYVGFANSPSAPGLYE